MVGVVGVVGFVGVLVAEDPPPPPPPPPQPRMESDRSRITKLGVRQTMINTSEKQDVRHVIRSVQAIKRVFFESLLIVICPLAHRSLE